ncbi:MAG: gliding motility-associated C-terminal domain-containing protein, partial [Flavobacteriales bacterium]|nr:gliding motility-associated C-terminal domain-containing protein [Flavobacteriales bacterium]
NGCINIDSIKITVNPLPIVNAGLNIQICIGDTTTLLATGGDSYVWTPTDSLATPVNNSTLAWPTDTTTYFVQVADSNLCENWDSVTVIVNPLPAASAGADLWLCPSDTIEMIATGGDVYTWLITDSLGSPNNDTTLIWPMDTVDYEVEVTDLNGCTFWDTTRVIVNPVVPTDAGPDTSICFLDSVIIGGNPTSPLGTTFSWSSLYGMNDSLLANPTVSPANTFTYSVETVNHVCNGTDTVVVIVNPLPLIDAGVNTQICLFDTAQLVASGGVSYIWAPTDSLSNDSIADPLVYPTDTTTYYVSGTDANGCVNIDSIIVTVNPFPIVDAGQNVQICIDDSTELIATGGDTYIWSPQNNLSTPLNDSTYAAPTDTTQYFVLVTDSNGCVNTDSVIVTVNPFPIVDAGLGRQICIGDSTELIATGGDSYSWTPLNSLSTPLNDSTFATPVDTTQYFVQVTDSNSCISIDSVKITVNPQPAVSAGIDQQICIGDTAQLIATGGDSYSWTPLNTLSTPNNDSTLAFPTDTTSYTVTIIDSNACENFDIVIVIVNPLPVVDAGTDTTSCRGTPVIIGGTPTGPPLSTYAWSPNFQINDTSLANPTVNPTQTNTYWVMVTDSNSCIDFDVVTVNIFNITTMEDTSMCQFTDLVLSVNTVSGVGPYTYNWAPDSNLTNTIYDTTTASPTVSTIYYISVTDGNGCLESDSIEIEVFEAPMSIFDYTLLPSCEGLLAEFENQSTLADSYFWEFNNGGTSTETEPTTLFSYDQELIIRLIATNEFGCSDTTDYSEPVDGFAEYVELNPSRVFTPNGDGINDLFEISGNFDLTGCVDLQIFNRWGVLVFSSSGSFASWDGYTFAGEPVPDGVYFYIMEINGMIFKKSITLNR